MNLPWLVRHWLGLPHPKPDRQPVGPAPFTVPPEPVRHREEAAVRAAPEDPRALRTYADWLSDQHDPRGALVRAMLDGEPVEPWVEREPRLLGPLAGQDGVSLTWRAGLWRTLRIERAWEDGQLGPLLRAVLADPAALVLESLQVRADTLPALPEALSDAGPLRLHTLDAHATDGQLGAWWAAWPRLQALRTLALHGRDPQLGDIALPALRTLRIHSPLDAEALWALARMHAPSLQQLEVRGVGADAEAEATLRERFPFADLQ